MLVRGESLRSSAIKQPELHGCQAKVPFFLLRRREWKDSSNDSEQEHISRLTPEIDWEEFHKPRKGKEQIQEKVKVTEQPSKLIKIYIES